MPDRSRRAIRGLLTALLGSGLLLALAATPSLAADPRAGGGPTPTGVQATVERTRTVDLSRDTAIVRQYTSYWCVPASAQTMINLVKGTSDRSYATQERLYRDIRAANKYHYSTNGNDVRGWARVLTARLGTDRAYNDMSFGTRADAYAKIVETMDRTKRPAGIVVDRGTHAWTVVGFKVHEVLSEPRSRTILGFYVVGPLGAGKDPWPKAYFTVDQLSTRFTRYHEWQMSVVWEGKYVIVAPVVTTGAATTSR
ncbi:MAG TPA: hypothetical protein VFV72_16015 [Candidatus Limnocylindrales bacterium]|nr:hypothetical protein [Candidatus Limnocylindrales bacterium]